MFNPGETVVHIFNIPFDSRNIVEAYVSYRDREHVIYVDKVTSDRITLIEEEDLEEGTPGKSQLKVFLDQQVSLLFKEHSNYKIQVNILMGSGSRFASKEINGSSGTQHIQEVITHEQSS